MKRIIFCTLFGLCSFAFLHAVNYCATSSWGYAGNSVTGGGNATPTLVTNATELSAALGKKNSVIIITQDITVSNHISSDKSNMTIMALPGVKLISNKQNEDESGILYLKGSNLLLRNLTFVGPGAYDCDGWDNLCLDGAKNVWVDHCDFQDGCDGNFDIKAQSDNITVTWCRFRYLKAPKAGGSGGADDHRYSNLVGSGSTDKPSDGKYSITYAYSWWDEGCVERMTRCRNAELHFLNCYWNSSVANYYVGPENASCYFEGCTFAGAANSANKIWKPYDAKINGQYVASVNYCKFVNCSGNTPSNSGSVSAPSYSYDQLSAASALTYVTNSTCGAGATLTVTNTAAVSSSCDSEEPEPEPQPSAEIDTVRIDTWWNMSDDDFKNLGTITSSTAVRDLLIVANSDNPVTVDGSSKTLDNISFTSRLKLGGTGAAEYRHLEFLVTGECTIEAYLLSSSSTADRELTVAAGTFSNSIGSMPASGTIFSKQSVHYTGNATRIYLYSASSGINIYGIRLTYSEGPSALTPIQNQSAAHKVLRHGQVFIIRDDKTYNLLGTRIE